MQLSYPVATLKRIVKYANKGYNISKVAQEFVRMVNNHNSQYSEEEMRGYID